MSCFLGCFKGSKDRKRSRKPKKSLLAAKNESIVFCPSSSPKEIILETEVATGNLIPKLRENQEQGAVANVRKKVTFDLNATTFESATVYVHSNDFWEDDEIDGNVKEEKKYKEEKVEEKREITDALRLVAYPPNHRYQNYESSDDEGLYEEEEYSDGDEEIDIDECNASGCGEEEESYDSYFSLPMESPPMHFQEVSSSKDTGEAATEMELVVVSKGNVRDRSKYIHSVLNPVENLSHWKEVKVRPASLKNPNKENINFDSESQILISPEPTMKSKKPRTASTNPDFANKEITVDASLSTWLISPNHSIIEPEKSTSFLSNLAVSKEECPILGVLDMEDIKHFSRASSPRRSPSWKPEEIPIVGTVGGYWSPKSKDSLSSLGSSASEKRGIPNITSKYREDKTVSWHCTPFETRLERALELEYTGTCCNVESAT